MSCIVACLGKNVEDFTYINKLIDGKFFNNVYLISIDDTEYDHDISGVKISLIVADGKKDVSGLANDIKSLLDTAFKKDKIIEMDIAVNIHNGSGIEHSAILSAIMKMGYGIRLVELINGEIVEM